MTKKEILFIVHDTQNALKSIGVQLRLARQYRASASGRDAIAEAERIVERRMERHNEPMLELARIIKQEQGEMA